MPALMQKRAPSGSGCRGSLRADLVVIDPPRLTFYSSVVQAQEPKGIEAFCPDAAVEGLSKGVIRRFAGPAEVEHDTVRPGPQVEILRDEFWPIIQTNPLRPTIYRREPIQGLHDICTAVARPHIERRRQRLKLSMIDSTRILRPSNSWSDRKSIDQHSFGADAGGRSSWSFAFTFRLGVLLRSCRPISRYSRCVRLWLMSHPSLRSRTWIRRYP